MPEHAYSSMRRLDRREFLRAAAGIPLRFEIWEHALDLIAVDPVIALVWPGIRHKADLAAWNNFSYNCGQLADPVIF